MHRRCKASPQLFFFLAFCETSKHCGDYAKLKNLPLPSVLFLCRLLFCDENLLYKQIYPAYRLFRSTPLQFTRKYRSRVRVKSFARGVVQTGKYALKTNIDEALFFFCLLRSNKKGQRRFTTKLTNDIPATNNCKIIRVSRRSAAGLIEMRSAGKLYVHS